VTTGGNISFLELFCYLYECKRTSRPNKLAQEAMLLTRARKTSDVNESWRGSVQPEDCFGFPQFLQANVGTVPQIRSRSLPCPSFQIYYSLMILQLDAL
jgi:hypothetical protein